MAYLMILISPKLLNNPFASSPFINFDFLLPHTAHFNAKNGLSSFVFETLESAHSVSFFTL